MSDKEKIRQLLAAYVQKTDDFDARGKNELFAEDGRYYPASGEVVGREAIYNTVATIGSSGAAMPGSSARTGL